MATWPTILEPNMVHVRHRTRPLAEMPHMWQPHLNNPNPDHSSHCDRIQAGWRKWGGQYPDWYARKACAQEPDWYSRRVAYTREADTKNRLWSWEKTDKPTEKRAFGLTHEHETPKPVQKGFQATPHFIEGQVAMPKWGLYNPPHYQDPSRVEALPAIHPDRKQL